MFSRVWSFSSFDSIESNSPARPAVVCSVKISCNRFSPAMLPSSSPADTSDNLLVAFKEERSDSMRLDPRKEP